MDISAQEVLNYMKNNCTIILDDVLFEMENMKREECLKQHPYDIWMAYDNRWKTYLPDSTKKTGQKMIARKNRVDIKDTVIGYYQKQEADGTRF